MRPTSASGMAATGCGDGRDRGMARSAMRVDPPTDGSEAVDAGDRPTAAGSVRGGLDPRSSEARSERDPTAGTSDGPGGSRPVRRAGRSGRPACAAGPGGGRRIGIGRAGPRVGRPAGADRRRARGSGSRRTEAGGSAPRRRRPRRAVGRSRGAPDVVGSARPSEKRMMGIAQKVSRDFSDAVRSRGQSYFAKGRVVVTAAVGGRGRRQGAGDGQVPGPAPAPRGASSTSPAPARTSRRPASRASTSGRRS